ncbi:hypothetical protein [Desulfobulbus elongatus]|uniref:hypothetical protein n=1 Tax=Desulfobulbus elongatus TaxID=53332 RepID=UPI0012F94E81|nr:hypothetical protein [Desulfobulbus elongatus]
MTANNRALRSGPYSPRGFHSHINEASSYHQKNQNKCKKNSNFIVDSLYLIKYKLPCKHTPSFAIAEAGEMIIGRGQEGQQAFVDSAMPAPKAELH